MNGENVSDVHTKEQRSYNMSQIRGKNTKPELLLRNELWKRGFRYRIKNNLPGKPDLVFARHKMVVFVDGCFWHKCPNHFTLPKTNTDFWSEKINKNVERDKRNNSDLKKLGWKVIRIWEHDIKQDVSTAVCKIIDAIYGK